NITIKELIFGKNATTYGLLYRLYYRLESSNSLNLIICANQVYASFENSYSEYHKKFMIDLKTGKNFSKMYNSWSKDTTNFILKTNLDTEMCLFQLELKNKSMLSKMNNLSNCEKKLISKISMKTKKIFSVLINFNKKIYNVKFLEIMNYKKKRKKKSSMKKIVDELIDLSVRVSEYNKKNRGNITKQSWDNWLEMFIKGRPLLVSLDDEMGLLLDTNYVENNKPNAYIELKTHQILNHADLCHYLNGTSFWSNETLGINIKRSTGENRILSLLVFDVLSSLYSLPPPIVGTEFSVYGSIMGIIQCDLEESMQIILFEKLIKRSILPVTPELALRYCMNAFFREIDSNELLMLLEFNNDEEICFENLQVKHHNLKSKQTQTAKIEYDQFVGKACAECGINAFLSIYKGKLLQKHHLVDCILCFIKEKCLTFGAVLVGYPHTADEIMLIEERLANKISPPVGLLEYMKKLNLTVTVQFKDSELGDSGCYRSSLTKIIRILASDNLQDVQWNSIDQYYKAQGILTILKASEKNMLINDADLEFFCDVITNETVKWNKSLRWINVTQSTMLENSNFDYKSQLSNSFIQNKSTHKTFKRGRLRGKSEFDFVEHITTMNAKMFSNILLYSPSSQMTNISQVTTNLFYNQIRREDGITMGRVWMSLENLFVESMESCFFNKRILLSEQVPYIITIKNILNGMLRRQDINKIELVKQLQTNLSKVPLNNDILPLNITKTLLSAVSDVRVLLIQKTNLKIEKCKKFIEKEIIETWLDKQMHSLFAVYMCMLQSELDRAVNTLIFINTYMSKMFKQKLILASMPKVIDILLLGDHSRARINISSRGEVLGAKFEVILRAATTKIMNMYSTISSWLDETKKIMNFDSLETSPMYLTLWKFVVQMEKWKTSNQLKRIMARCRIILSDMKNSTIQHIFDMNKQIENRLQHELAEIKNICNLFETTIIEGRIVRHDIFMINDCFYLNIENALYPNITPPYPFPLLEQNNFIITTERIEILIMELSQFCPEKYISIKTLSFWWNYKANDIPRNMFGYSVNFIDWTDFVLNLMELPNSNIDDLLNLNSKYSELEEKYKNDNNYIPGMIKKDDVDSIPLWFENILPITPSVFLRYLKIKKLLLVAFTIENKIDYKAMLLALCKDDCSISGLTKALSVLMNKNLLSYNDSQCSENNDKLPMETLMNILILCLGNYTIPGNTDLEELVNSLKKSTNNIRTTLKILRSNELKVLTEIGFRFKRTYF
ncbi:uncharacterized protein LOC126897912, partial [Daktulosphaira vitifoliae]|uniref:uncharacterized protein LOC126897912 n=1 Tax=Daktulosphaira vitifoliae TaxID=58002 RepID=UPI0021AAA074